MVGHFLLHQGLWDDADDFTARSQGGICQSPHQARSATSINDGDFVDDKMLRQNLRSGSVFRASPGTGAAKNAESFTHARAPSACLHRWLQSLRQKPAAA